MGQYLQVIVAVLILLVVLRCVRRERFIGFLPLEQSTLSYTNPPMTQLPEAPSYREINYQPMYTLSGDQMTAGELFAFPQNGWTACENGPTTYSTSMGCFKNNAVAKWAVTTDMHDPSVEKELADPAMNA